MQQEEVFIAHGYCSTPEGIHLLLFQSRLAKKIKDIGRRNKLNGEDCGLI